MRDEDTQGSGAASAGAAPLPALSETALPGTARWSAVSRWQLRATMLQWTTGLICALVGTLMLIVPHQLSGPAYDAVRPSLPIWGAGVLLVGLTMLVVASTGPARWLILVAHSSVGIVLLLIASLFVASGGWYSACILGTLGVATILAPGIARAPRGGPAAADLFTLAMGAAIGLLGVLILLAPGLFSGPGFDWMRPYLQLHGLAFLLCSAAVLATSLSARAPWWSRWLAAVLLAGVVLLPMLTRALGFGLWTGITLYGLTGLALIADPWLGPFLARTDPRSLHTRLAVAVALGSALALIAVVTVDTNREEATLREQAMASQQSLATALAHDVADYVELHEAAVRALAAGPGLMDRAADEQTAWLRAHTTAYPNVVVFSTFDARGVQLARSDGRPLIDVSASAWFERVRATGQSIRLVASSTSIQRPIFAYGAPVLNADGTLRGLVTATVESSRIADQLSRVVSDPNQRAYLVDSQGRTVAHPDQALIAGFANLRGLQPVAALLSADAPAGSLVYSAERDEWLAGYARVPGLEWGVVVEHPASVALTSVRAGRERAFAALLVLVCVAAAIGAATAGWLTAPLAVLSRAVERLADGATDAQLGASGITEITRLAGAFGEMRERLAARTLEHERSEAALRESEQRFRMMANSAPVLIWMSGTDGGCTFFNDGWLQFTGRTLAEELGDGWTAGVHPDDLVRCLQTSRAAIAAWEPFAMEYRLRRADGVYRWIADVAAPRFESDGTFAGYIGSCNDVTERREAEEAQRLSEERLRLALEAGRMGAWDWNAVTNELQWDGSLEELHGLPRGSFDGRYETFVGIIHPDDRKRTLATIQAALPEAGQFATEFRVTWPDGSIHWIAGLGRAYHDEHGRPARMVGIGLEVTERRRAVEVQHLLAEAGSRLVSSLDYETTLHTIAQLVATTMADYCIVEVQREDGSRSIEVAHADPATADYARTLLDTVAHHGANGASEYGPEASNGHASAAWTDRTVLLPAPLSLEQGGPLECGSICQASPEAHETRETQGNHPGARSALHATDHGRLAQALGMTSLISVPLLARERTIGVLTLISAESGRRYGQEDLGLAEALAARAALAVDNARLYSEAQAAVRTRDEFLSIASHELRTPVAGIKGYAQLLLRAQDRNRLEAARLTRSLRAIDEATDRLTTLTQDLLDVSRIRLGQLPLRQQETDLDDLVRRVTHRFSDQLPATHEIVVDVQTAIPPIQADADRLEQVVTNLLDNARKYAPDGGVIRVTLAQTGDQVVLSVQDSGIGLPADATESIFRPFGRAPNATSRNLPGMGLGLYICRNIVERHGGRITVQSVGEGHGTTFEIALPCQPATRPDPAAPPVSAASASLPARP